MNFRRSKFELFVEQTSILFARLTLSLPLQPSGRRFIALAIAMKCFFVIGVPFRLSTRSVRVEGLEEGGQEGFHGGLRAGHERRTLRIHLVTAENGQPCSSPHGYTLLSVCTNTTSLLRSCNWTTQYSLACGCFICLAPWQDCHCYPALARLEYQGPLGNYFHPQGGQ